MGLKWKKFDKQKINHKLYQCLAKIDSAKDFEALLQDLCTPSEVEQMAQRLLCAKLLLKGYTYSQIIEITDISSATLSRVSRCIKYGSGGYAEIVGKMVEADNEKD